MTFRPAPLRAAAVLAAVFIAARVVYRVLFNGAGTGSPVLLNLPPLRLPAPSGRVAPPPTGVPTQAVAPSPAPVNAMAGQNGHG